MEKLSISQWRGMAASDPKGWTHLLANNLADCIENTGRSVMSASLVDSCELGKGVLSGLPYAVKDLFDVAGLPTHSSSILPHFLEQRAEASSEIVTHMLKLGASCAAKTQMNEFAYGLSGENPHYGDCAHPYLKACLSGGSSSGSAHTVAAGYLPLAFGTDTGGSIRLPAAWCGIYGVRWKPHYFMGGCFPLAPSFDSMGWFTRTAEDMRVMLEAWFENSAEPLHRPLKGKCFLPHDMVLPEAHDALDRFFKNLDLTEVEQFDALRALLPDCQQAFNVLQSREAYAVHEPWLEKHAALYDPQVLARILRARDWNPEDVAQAGRTMKEVSKWFDSYFETHDFLAMPICPSASVPVGEAKPELREQTLQLTTPASLAALPALTIPVWLDAPRSVGIQFIFKEIAPSVPLAILDLCDNF
jgi:amidase/aspartyl-tRNA(Asn)/glutamyl-tRNA(Gln) amidotransferase subunit A